MSPRQIETILDRAWESLGREVYTKNQVHGLLTRMYRELRTQQIAALGRKFDEVAFDRFFVESLKGEKLPDALAERLRGVAA